MRTCSTHISSMSMVLEIHLVFAFLVLLCALVFSWNSLGQRVMGAVLGAQILIGVIAVGMLGKGVSALAPSIWWHLAVAIAALLAYMLARRLGDRPGGKLAGIALGALGLVLVIVGLYIGLHMAGRVA